MVGIITDYYSQEEMVLELHANPRLGVNSHAEAQSTQSSFFKRVRGEDATRRERGEKTPWFANLQVNELAS